MKLSNTNLKSQMIWLCLVITEQGGGACRRCPAVSEVKVEEKTYNTTQAEAALPCLVAPSQ